jgi:hypothetical protein
LGANPIGSCLFLQSIISPSDPDFETIIAITIAIENRSGKIGNRFSFRNRIPIFAVKSISDFHMQIGSRLKTGFWNGSTDGT